MVATFMVLIMTKRMTPVLALIIVPTIFGLFAGAGLGIGDMAMEAIGGLAPTAALLMFAIIYFGLMIDVGLFDPLVRIILRVVGHDPVKVVVGTALLAAVISLDGDGSTTFIVVTSALLPIYLRLGLSPVVLTCIAGLANGTMNILPWGGPTARAAAALDLSPTDVFVPMIPSMLVGLAIIFVFAWHLGLMERKRLGTIDLPGEADAATGGARGSRGTRGTRGTGTGSGKDPRGAGSRAAAGTQVRRISTVSLKAIVNPADTAMADTMLDPQRPTLRPKLFWFNLVLTVVVMVLLVADVLPLAYVFMAGSAIAIIVNFPRVSEQAERIVAHAPSIVGVVSMVIAAGVLIGVLEGTGMVDAMAAWVAGSIPAELGAFSAVITGLLSIPMTFFLSNDAFYFGILPVLAESASAFGIDPVDMARASITGQVVHMQSPLVPAILLLVSLAGVNLGDHHKKVLWRAVVVALAMLVVGVVIGAIGIG
ncbi:SLC13 family permease [Herbiconiux sp. CPCC 203407]|uniref:SLC13 family permease n=1 Tax=Herbiconiux oxytropis TaxID=2970915 RepID=A0AA41XB57_9MICO|nr:SLC13 family permease [Herbiconiux oxytropis]MCS5720684.1 SLC13 family permease [Herbiconiux oxytropis]MCS5724989.1 SLC13 family permease [Herbiconiux oxytropis]